MAKLHRFYVGDLVLEYSFLVQDKALFHQWTKVLRFQIGREIVLFNDQRIEKLYRILQVGDVAIRLEMITELVPKISKNNVYLCFSLLKKDKNDWVLQKGTELGVRHFVPMLCERTEKTGFDLERANKIVIEASEQCGRADIPRIREPLHISKLIDELSDKVDLFVAEQGSPSHNSSLITHNSQNSVGILIGPEGGWSDAEKQLFKDKEIKHLALSEFTLRAETAAITAAALLQ